MKTKQGTLLLAVVLAAPAFAFADNISGHSQGGNKYVTLSDGFTSQQGLQDNSARCTFLFSSPKENGLRTSSFSGASLNEIAKGEESSNLGALSGTGMGSEGRPVTVVDFGGNKGSSFGRDKGKGPGKDNGGDGGGNGTGGGSDDPSPPALIAEPGSRALLLFGLGGLGLVCYRRKALTNAI